ncbi:MAG TPA: hypothetical protein VFR36_04525 [Sphingomicrobium sp.]|nr:hypothetical protein [Sphingomicrobium sp.]
MKRWLGVAALALLTGCATLMKEPPYVVGIWGGPHIAVAFQGAFGEVRFDCATGTIDGLVMAAQGGAFSVRGVYRAGATGPIRVGQRFIAQTATYSGEVVKDVMTLNVELEDGTLLGPFTLTKGTPPTLASCL